MTGVLIRREDIEGYTQRRRSYEDKAETVATRRETVNVVRSHQMLRRVKEAFREIVVLPIP